MRFINIYIAAVQLLFWFDPIVARNTVRTKTCTVKANGDKKDDVPNILEAFQKCGNGGKIVFPESESYWIATKLNPVLENVEIEWRGEWTVCGFSNLKSALTDLLHSSFRMISITGEIIHTPSRFKIMQLGLSFLAIESRSMGMELGVLMAMGIPGILPKQVILNLVGQCHLYFGMYLR